jgi:hypothetical protein
MHLNKPVDNASEIGGLLKICRKQVEIVHVNAVRVNDFLYENRSDFAVSVAE